MMRTENGWPDAGKFHFFSKGEGAALIAEIISGSSKISLLTPVEFWISNIQYTVKGRGNQ